MDMVKEYSIIKDGKVINRIICDGEFALQYAQENGVEVSDSVDAVIGATKSKGGFVKPVTVQKDTKTELELLTEKLVAKGVLTEAEVSTLKAVK